MFDAKPLFANAAFVHFYSIFITEYWIRKEKIIWWFSLYRSFSLYGM